MDTASDFKQRLAESAEAVCRRYLSNGRREGRYWLVGDLYNSPGRSLYVRLHGGAGGAGRWTDAATGEHGDLLDLIAAGAHLAHFPEVLAEARRFLSLPEADGPAPRHDVQKAPTGSPEAARRLWAASRPIAGTLADTYLRARSLEGLRPCPMLRFHPRCFYRHRQDEAPTQTAWPALITAMTDLTGEITGVQRTWLAEGGLDKAPVGTPRRAMGVLGGHAVRFGRATDTLAAGEGLETVLSLRAVAPTLPLAAALSASNLAALKLSPGLRRLYVVQDNDDAGRRATHTLLARAAAHGIDALPLTPLLGDLNDDLQLLGAGAMASHLRTQFVPQDIARFWRDERRLSGPGVAPAGALAAL